MLQGRGDGSGAEELRRASTHFLRHTFAKAALVSGHSMRGVASALGHADMSTTMRYTEQAAQDLIIAWELADPGSVAVEVPVLPA